MTRSPDRVEQGLVPAVRGQVLGLTPVLKSARGATYLHELPDAAPDSISDSNDHHGFLSGLRVGAYPFA